MTLTEAIPGHIIETVDATIGVLHNAITSVLIITAMTHHIEDVTPNHALDINQVRKLCISLHSILAELQ